MKRVQLLTFISLSLIFFTSFTASGKKEEIKLRLFRGEHYIYVITRESTIQNNSEEEAMLSGLLRSLGSEQFLLEFYNYIPLKSVAVGDKWRLSCLPKTNPKEIKKPL